MRNFHISHQIQYADHDTLPFHRLGTDEIDQSNMSKGEYEFFSRHAYARKSVGYKSGGVDADGFFCTAHTTKNSTDRGKFSMHDTAFTIIPRNWCTKKSRSLWGGRASL